MTDAVALCLDCSEPLDGRVNPLRHTITCRCGLEYTVELIEQRDEERWERVRTERLFERKDDTLWITEGVFS